MGYYSIDIDWQEDYKNDFEKWDNLGRHTAEDECDHTDQDNGDETNMRYSGYCDKCGYSEDDCYPMMNYAYPLMCKPTEEAIKKVIQETCLTVMHNTNTDEYFLALCGGGMNLSQSIALAYLFTDQRIPNELILEVCKQKGLSVGGENWKILRQSIIEQLKQDSKHSKRMAEEWEKTQE